MAASYAQAYEKSADKIEKKAVRESVKSSVTQILTNYQLIKLEGGAKRPFALEELTYQYDGKTTNQVLEGIGVK